MLEITYERNITEVLSSIVFFLGGGKMIEFWENYGQLMF